MSAHDDECPNSRRENERLIGAMADKEISIGIARSSSALICPSATGTTIGTATATSARPELSNSPMLEIGAAAADPLEPAPAKGAWRILDNDSCWHECKGERLIRAEDWIEIWDIGPTRLVAAFLKPAAVLEK